MWLLFLDMCPSWPKWDFFSSSERARNHRYLLKIPWQEDDASTWLQTASSNGAWPNFSQVPNNWHLRKQYVLQRPWPCAGWCVHPATCWWGRKQASGRSMARMPHPSLLLGGSWEVTAPWLGFPSPPSDLDPFATGCSSHGVVLEESWSHGGLGQTIPHASSLFFHVTALTFMGDGNCR